ncbi:MAG: type II secretion system F family protein [Gluconacetobacter diazotrophicus]|nr:type II secretion system F family protein [Gluconacetobacter diazotrophicus]
MTAGPAALAALAGWPSLPLAFAASGAAAGLLLLLSRSRDRQLGTRVRLARGENRAARPRRERRRLSTLLGALGTAVVGRGLLPARTVRELEQTLAAAGIAPGRALGLFIASKMIGALALPGLVLVLVPHLTASAPVRIGATFAAFVVGLLLPDTVIRRQRTAHVRRLEAGLGDALDMMVICAEAGLALEPALNRVAVELAPVHPVLAAAIARTVGELQVTTDSRAALQAFGSRSGVTGMKRLGAAMIQSMHHGTPLIQVLRTLSVEMRGEMLLRFEERAARLPALLTVPMILFILPCVFLVVGGPAMVQVLQNFRH